MKPRILKCPYCGKRARHVSGLAVYPHRPDLNHKRFYLCRPCDAHVGCHGTGSKPLGTMANAELREFRQAAHRAFDPLWKGKGSMSRNEAYAWLAGKLGLPREKTHIGMFDKQQCCDTMAACDEWKVKHG